MDGPRDGEALSAIVAQALPVLVASLVDPVVLVQDTSAWTLARVAE